MLTKQKLFLKGMYEVIIIIGVSGSGKSTIGKELGKILNIPFYDGDDFHPAENIYKMKKGLPLNDDDRKGWLDAIQVFCVGKITKGSLIIACSALKEKYRKLLSDDGMIPVRWVFLDGSFDLILKRLQKRQDHFMPTTLLKSQFLDLERPKSAIKVDISLPIDIIINTIINQLKNKKMSEFGLIGLGVMGKSLSRNLARNGFTLSLYNRYVRGKEERVAKTFVHEYAELKRALAFEDLTAFVGSLEKPRKIFLMVNAGAAVDQTINNLVPLLEMGDVIIDGGNSHFKETQRRHDDLKAKGIHYVGTGVSGGEKGALEGPSIMPGGSSEGYKMISNYLESTAAKDINGNACCSFVGSGGAGHFVKMVHNGIEYAEMQLLAEIYSYLRYVQGKTVAEIAELFTVWNEGELQSYLLEITGHILRKKDGEKNLIDLILDKAGNKGTGSWTTISACELGVPIPTITEALFARYISFYKEKRNQFTKDYFQGFNAGLLSEKDLAVLYQTCRIINHHQGFHLINAASVRFNWDIDFPELSRVWTNGCIIRSDLMQVFSGSINDKGEILTIDKIKKHVSENWSLVLSAYGSLVQSGIAIPCISASIQYFQCMKQKPPSANIIQAQRDYFGAHTYERVDDPTGKKHHTLWETL